MTMDSACGRRSSHEGGSDVAPRAAGGEGGRAFLVYANFKTILRWNRSDFFGAAVGLLADRISAG